MSDSIPLKVQADSRPGRGKRLLLHSLRIVLFIAILGIIHLEYRAQRHIAGTQSIAGIEIELVRAMFPNAHSLRAEGDVMGAVSVYSKAENTLGYLIQTAPQSDEVIGYAGSTNVLLAFNSEHELVGSRVIRSEDSREYVEQITNAPNFFEQFAGQSYDELGKLESVDAVSGATLTSQAIAQSIALRLSGEKPSLRFPRALTIEDVQETVPAAERLEPNRDQAGVYDIYDEDGNLLGSVTRTSPVSDEMMGYQGPTDTQMLFRDEVLKELKIRDTYETPKYADYVREDSWFHELFEGKSLEQIAAMNPDEVEGVSGATMTSQTMGRAMIRRARQLTDNEGKQASQSVVNISIHDIIVLVIVVFAMLMGWTRLKQIHKLRMIFQWVLIVYVGFMVGHLISLKSMAGWSQSGLPYQNAIGLTAMGIAALLIPILSRTHFYCHQLCPYGAAQERIKHITPFNYKLPHKLHHALLVLPVVLICVALVIVLEHLPIDVALLEPFPVFNYQIAGVITFVVAGVGLVFACFVPMGFCRYACPTGALLGYLRFNSNSGELTRRDIGAFAMLLIAGACKWII